MAAFPGVVVVLEVNALRALTPELSLVEDQADGASRDSARAHLQVRIESFPRSAESLTFLGLVVEPLVGQALHACAQSGIILLVVGAVCVSGSQCAGLQGLVPDKS